MWVKSNTCGFYFDIYKQRVRREFKTTYDAYIWYIRSQTLLVLGSVI